MLHLILRMLRPPMLRVGVAVAVGILVTVAFVSVTNSAGPPLPHPIDGYKDCLLCHGAGKIAPLPYGHSSYSADSCVGCHAESTATPTQPSSPAASSSPGSSTERGSAQALPLSAPPVAKTNSDRDGECLACHQNQSLSVKLASGDDFSLYIDGSEFHNSVHGSRLGCTDCHPNMAVIGGAHQRVRYESRRHYTTTYYEACKRCHFANYTKTLDSVHYDALSGGNTGAPVCTDCHGSHYVTKVATPRTSISQECGQCHDEVYRGYADSVHGQALAGDGNPDVPVCTTCHGVHNIPAATSGSFRLTSAQLCAGCHADAGLMAKYGLSAGVLKTYLDDFHGRTVSFYQQAGSTEPLEPLCIDCHGIHDIKSAKDPDSPVIRNNLQATCQKCHADASPNFPAAWLAHYEPSPDQAPLVYYVRLYYWILIPMMIGGLVLHVALDLWRLARNR